MKLFAQDLPGATANAKNPRRAVAWREMLPGMEQYVDLHEGDLDGPLVPIHCGWSPDHTTLGCTPDAPLKTRTRYTLHVGGGMMDAGDHPVDLATHGPPDGRALGHG